VAHGILSQATKFAYLCCGNEPSDGIVFHGKMLFLKDMY